MRLLVLLVFAGMLALGQAEQTFDVRNGDQQGKLIVREAELSFESITDGRHSHTWKYTEIRGLSRKMRGFRVQPISGSAYDFQMGRELRDRVFALIEAKVIASRSNKRP